MWRREDVIVGNKISLDPALQPGETTEECNERLRTGKFEDERSLSEKVGKKVSDVAMPIMNQLGKMAAPAKVKDKMKAGGKVSSASSRADGCATKGKTKGRFV